MKLIVIYALFIACIAIKVNAESEDCENAKEELNLKLKFEIQSDQQQDSEDEQFVAVHVNQMGIEALDPKLPSIEAIVKSFLPKNAQFVNVISADREIVNGFKYEIFFVMSKTTTSEENEGGADEIYCVMDVLEKPWLIKDSVKYRKMTYNNCSLANPVDDDNRMQFQYEMNPVFVNQRTEMSEDDLRLMEDQIISIGDSNTNRRIVLSEAENLRPTEEDIVETTTVVLEDATLNPSSKNILDSFFNMQNLFGQQPSTTTTTTTEAGFNTTALDEMFGIKRVENSQSQASHSMDEIQEKNYADVDAAPPKKDNETLRDLEVEFKKAFSELFQSDPDFQMNIIALINRNDNLQAEKNYNQIIAILGRKLKDKLDSYAEEQKNGGDQELEGEQQVTVNPNEPIVTSRRKRSNSIKFVVKEVQCSHEIDSLTCADCFLEVNENGEISLTRCSNREKRQGLGKPKHKRNKLGGARPLDVNDEDVQLFLNEAIEKVNGDEDPDYAVSKVLEATVQVVAGTLHKFKVEMIYDNNKVICDFEVWERVWLKDGRDVKINCDNNKIYKFIQTPVNQREKQEETKREKRETQDNVRIGETLVGGIQGGDKDDPEIKHLLNSHLHRHSNGDCSPLELVSIDKLDKQVVAGIRYLIRGTLKSNCGEKKCVIDLVHRAWQKGNEGLDLSANCEGEQLSTRSKRSIHQHHHRPRPDHEEEHHHHARSHDRHQHHSSATRQMEEVKSEILFENFVKKFERRYANDAEQNLRLRIFKRNLHKIEMLNKHEQGTAKYGITEFADMTQKEYLRRTGLVVPESHENSLSNPIADIPDVELPESFDWRDKAVVTDVKNQGNCGSCWSFSVTGNIEGLHAIKTGKLEAYSEQELLDCDTKDNACNGGFMDDAFKAIEQIGGLELEDEYPYKAKKQNKCLYNQTLSHVKVKGVVDLPKGDEVAMQKFLVSTGPISIGINANAMQFYRGGVSHPWKLLCRKSNLDHGVLIVGYGKKEYPTFNKTLPYWTIKNSWGPKWGEQGYYRVYRGENTCGVAEMASSAVLE